MPPKIDLNPLASIADIDARRNFVGDAIYETIENAFGGEFAPKITGILIESANFEQLLTDAALLT